MPAEEVELEYLWQPQAAAAAAATTAAGAAWGAGAPADAMGAPMVHAPEPPGQEELRGAAVVAPGLPQGPAWGQQLLVVACTYSPSVAGSFVLTAAAPHAAGVLTLERADRGGAAAV